MATVRTAPIASARVMSERESPSSAKYPAIVARTMSAVTGHSTRRSRAHAQSSSSSGYNTAELNANPQYQSAHSSTTRPMIAATNVGIARA